MKKSVHYPLDKEQAKLLKQLDAWLMDNMLTQGGEAENMLMALRERITKIQVHGYYDTGEKELLNELRYQYLEELKGKEK
jgi:hypothetical protein